MKVKFIDDFQGDRLYKKGEIVEWSEDFFTVVSLLKKAVKYEEPTPVKPAIKLIEIEKPVIKKVAKRRIFKKKKGK